MILIIISIFQAYNSGKEQVNTINRASSLLRFSGSTALSSSGPIANLSFSSKGVLGQILPPVELSYSYDRGFFYSLGSLTLPLPANAATGLNKVEIVSSSMCNDTLTFPLAGGWKDGLLGQPAIIAQNVTQTNFVVSQENPVSGPATISAVLGGVDTWPEGGAGLLIPPSSDILVAISANGSGSVNATLRVYSWVQGIGFLDLSESDTFPMNTMSYQNLTVASNGWGEFSILLNSIPTLSVVDDSHVPNVGPVGLWVGEGGSMNFDSIIVKTANTVHFKVPSYTCHTITVIPFAVATLQEVSITSETDATILLLGVNKLSGVLKQMIQALDIGQRNLAIQTLELTMTYLAVVDSIGEYASNDVQISNANLMTLDPNTSIEVSFPT